jgi:hypothetical protein
MNKFENAFLVCLLGLGANILASELHPGHRPTDRSQLWEHSGDILGGFCNMYQMKVFGVQLN